MKLLRFKSKIPYGANTYLLKCGNEAVLIDPTVSVADISDDIKDTKIKYIVITHAHFDHILTLGEWQEVTQAPILTGEADVLAIGDSYLNCSRSFLGSEISYSGEVSGLNESDQLIIFGETISVINTPGHTCGAIALYAEPNLIVGDTVFSGGGIGRTDLPGSDYHQLVKSIEKIRSFPCGTVIYPGHGEFFTI